MNSARGLENAAYYFNSRRPPYCHLNVYLGTTATFVCSNNSLTTDELHEAEALYTKLAKANQQNQQALCRLLLGPEGAALIAERQQHGRVDDNQYASWDIARALGFNPKASHVLWSDIKARIAEFQHSGGAVEVGTDDFQAG